MKKLRLSYSLLNRWGMGDIDGAVQTYFHMDTTPTPQMIEGRKLHEEIAKHIDDNKSFPSWFFDFELKKPETEKEVITSYNEMFDLKCIIDLLDLPLLFEFKTGVTDSLGWSRTDQIPLYFLICELAGIDVSSAFLIRHNQYAKNSDFCVVHNHIGLRDHARNVCDSIGPEIHTFFTEQGLL